MTTFELYCTDAVSLMTKLGEESVDLIVTSPPYDEFDGKKTTIRKLRNYNDYTWDFMSIAESMYSVLKTGGAAVWVVGDFTKNRTESLTPFHQAIFFKSLGFGVETMLFKKHSVASRGSRDLYAQEFDFMFVLNKGKPNAVNLIRDIPNKYAGERTYPRKRHKTGELRPEKRLTIRPYRKRGNIWTFPVGNVAKRFKTEDHPAPFPYNLAEDHIKSWSNPGDLVLDFFAGSGITALAAFTLGRRFVVGDIDPNYCLGMQRTFSRELNLHLSIMTTKG